MDEIISCIFSDHSGMTLNNRRKTEKFKNMQRLNNIFMNNQQTKEEIKSKQKICIKKKTLMEAQHSKFYRMQQKQF